MRPTFEIAGRQRRVAGPRLAKCTVPLKRAGPGGLTLEAVLQPLAKGSNGRDRAPAGAPEIRLQSAATLRRKSASSPRHVLTLPAISSHPIGQKVIAPTTGSKVQLPRSTAVRWQERTQRRAADPSRTVRARATH